MKPEDVSACESARYYYKNPWMADVDTIKDLFEEYNVGFYTDLKFTFVYCLEAPEYIMPYTGYDDVLHVCGGKYLLRQYPNYNNTRDFIIDTLKYPFRDARPFYYGDGYIFNFLDDGYKKFFKGIIIGPVTDFTDNYSVECDGHITLDNGEVIEGKCKVLPLTDYIRACTITEDKYSREFFE